MGAENAKPRKSVLQFPLLRVIFPRGGGGDLVVSCVVIAIVMAMIVPVPSWLLDVLIGANICSAALLMILVMQLHESVGLSTFPSILLITTLFRISLNVASTRLILLEGDAGHIIEAFGNVVVGGNLVVGLVVFVILAVIQFIVITKGSERVAEVGARFTLDAMPGKQMAIDMELKAGSISALTARQQRAELARESQFFGAMDGAMKFVKGDAIVGIVVTLTNLIGGLAVGVMQRGMTASEAAATYSVLAIGDALVAQVPALLISLTAGLLTTRVSNTAAESGNVSRDLVRQLMAQPKAWIIASGAMLVFGALPGMPVAVFAAMAGGALTIGLRAFSGAFNEQKVAARREAVEVRERSDVPMVRAFVVRVSPALSEAQAMAALNCARTERNRLVAELGLVSPAIELQTADTQQGQDVEFLEDEVKVFGLKVSEDLAAVSFDAMRVSELHDVVTQDDGLQPNGWQRVWMPAGHAKALDPQWFRVSGFWDHFSTEVRACLLRSAPRHTSLQAIQTIISDYGATVPEVIKELDRNTPLLRVTEVFQRLLREHVSVRNVRAILNALVEWGAKERDAAVLAECVRVAIAREICASVAHQHTIHAYVMDPGFEDEVRVSVRQTAFGDYLALDPEVSGNALDGLASRVRQLPVGMRPVIATQQDIRPYVRQLIQARFPEIPVLSMAELAGNFSMNVLGVFSAAQESGSDAFEDEPLDDGVPA